MGGIKSPGWIHRETVDGSPDVDRLEINTVFGKKLDAGRVLVGHQDHPITADGEQRGRTKLARLGAFLAEGILVFAVQSKDLYAGVSAVGDIKKTVRADRNSI